MTPAKTDPPIRSSRTAILGASVFGLLCVLVATWLLLVPTRGALDEERDFRSAVGCASDGSVPGARGDDCLRTVEARIDRAGRVERGRKTARFWLYVTEADGTSTRTRLAGSPDEHPVTRPGTRVDVTYWRDRIRYVDFESTRRYTNADPRGDYRLPCAFGLGLGLYGLLLTSGVYVAARRSRTSVRAFSWQVNLTVAGALCLTALAAAAPWLTDSAGSAFRLVGLSVPVVLAACWTTALLLRRRRSDGDDTIAVTPSAPTTEHCFPGTVLGDIPYAGAGGYLVAGPALLASTPDPTGTAFRREVPSTLTPVRVRPPYLTDPGRPDHHCWVLECEDGGVPVLIITRKKTMPRVLGALRPTPSTAPRQP